MAGGGHSGLGPCVGFARLATSLFPRGLQSQISGDHAAGALGRFLDSWGLQHCHYELESLLRGKESCPPVTQMGLVETGVVRETFPKILGASARAVTGIGTQVALVIVRGNHELATGGEGFLSVACGLVVTSGATPCGPWQAITGGRD